MAVLGGIMRGTNVLDSSSRSHPNFVGSIAGGFVGKVLSHGFDWTCMRLRCLCM